MGLYIQTYAPKPKAKRWPWSKPLSEQIMLEAESWAKSMGIGPLFYSFETTSTLSHFTFFPLNESLRFEIDEKQVSIGIKTSSVGAGYHAAFIDLCDHLEVRLGLKWNWKLSGQESGDETGYAISRNFTDLQDQHLKQAASILNYVFSENMQAGACIHIDLDLMHNHNEIAGPRGYIDPVNLSDNQGVDSIEFKRFTEKILTWQEQAIDTKFWLATLESLLWHEFQWRVSYSAYDEYIENCIEFCTTMLVTADIPTELNKALEQYEFYSKNVVSPEVEGVGYRKRRLFVDLTGAWRCSVPGYFIHSMEDNNSTCHFTFDEIVYRGSSISMELKDGVAEFNWPEELVNSKEINRENFVYRLPNSNALADGDEGGCFGMGMGLTSNIGNKRHLVMFSVTAKNKDIVLEELEKQFETGIAFKGSE